jgi:ABC-type multidrug transport system fused ATPase/permease subunit
MFIGSWLILSGRMTIGNMMAFTFYIGYLYGPIVRISDANAMVERAITALEKIYEVMDTPSFVKEIPGAPDMPPVRGHVQFRDVQFAYDRGRNILGNITMEILPGQMVALVGPSGAGKTTLINLLCRFYDVDSGTISIDGIDIRNVRLKSLRRQIGIVMQENLLFSGSLLENIRYGNPGASLEMVESAAWAANIHDFIEGLPSKYFTAVGERGVKLSGGQRQRIAIARAILTDPRILIFDEATSALDSESEQLIQDAMDRFMKGRTTIVIAHRLSTIQRADRIIVLGGGEVKEQGTHAELLALDGLYRHLHDMQFREPEGD